MDTSRAADRAGEALRRGRGFATLALALVVGACGGDEPNEDGPESIRARFTVTLENRSVPPIALAAGTLGSGSGPAVAVGPGAALETTVQAPPDARLSVAFMLVPSNDLFVAPGPEGIPLFSDITKQPLNGPVTSLLRLWDAGTEADQPLGEGDTQANNLAGGQVAPTLGSPDTNAAVRTAQPTGLPGDLSSFVRMVITPSQTAPGVVTEFTVRVENTSTTQTLTLGSGSRDIRLAPGVWVVHAPDQPAPIFSPDAADRGQGLESLAEDGNPTVLAATLAQRLGPTVPLSPGAWAVFSGGNPMFTVGTPASMGLLALAEEGAPMSLAQELQLANVSSGTFTTPVSASGPGPIGPGASYQFSFEASPPAQLTFSTMYIESNDVFLAPSTPGFSLFNGSTPRNGAIDELALYDAGTETNEQPGFGANQPRRQEAQGSGMDEAGAVRLLNDVSDGFDYVPASSLLSATISSEPIP